MYARKRISYWMYYIIIILYYDNIVTAEIPTDGTAAVVAIFLSLAFYLFFFPRKFLYVRHNNIISRF